MGQESGNSKHVTILGLDGCPSLVLDEPDLTPSQQRVLLAVALLRAKLGRPPMLRELAVLIGVTWGAVFQTMRILKRKGYVTTGTHNQAGTLQVARPLRFREVGT